MSRHPLSQQEPPQTPGVYWVRLTPYDEGEPMHYSHGAFRLGAMVRPYYSWEPTEQTDTRSSARLWPERFQKRR